MTDLPEHVTPENKIRLRAVVIGFLLAMAICAVTPFNNAYRQATPLSGGHFPLAPFYILVWLTILTGIARKVARRHTFLTGKELLIAWALMLLASGIAYTGLVRTFFINLTAPYFFATVENRWQDVLWPLLPAGLYPQGKDAIAGLYNGLSEGRTMDWGQVMAGIPWSAWWTPLLVWGAFILTCYLVMICIVNILSRQALANERMNFPLLRVPILMEEALSENRLGRFFVNRFLLAGMAIPVLLHLINGLNFYFPSVPQIPTLILAGPYFSKYGLFSGFAKLKICIYPAFIGFAFLASKQISFSFWFFFLMGALLFGLLELLGYNIPAEALGVTFGPTLARPEETQMIGAFLVFFLFLMWLARQYFGDVLAHAFFIKKESTLGAEDWFSARLSFWGVMGGGLGIILWFAYFGLPVSAALVILLAFFIFTLVAMRVICQGGVAYFTLTAAPLDAVLAFFGPQFLTQAGIVIAAAAQKALFVDLRESLMPSILHARKLSHGLLGRRIILSAVIFTLVGAVVVSFVAMLALCYKYGVRELGLDWATGTTLTVYENAIRLVQNPVRPGKWVLAFIAIGAAIMLVLVSCYHRFYWWPLHPIGFLTAYSSAMRILWFSFLAGWICNALCMRYGGVVLFKRVRYFFIGLIIGDFLMGGTFAFIGLFSDASYQVLPD